MASALRRADASVDELESRGRSVQNAHERELGLMYDESMCVRSELEYRASTLELENQRINDEIASYIVMQEQNMALKESLAALHDRARDAEIRHRTEMERLKESLVEQKTRLHREFKIRLQEMSGQIMEDTLQSKPTDQTRAMTPGGSLQRRVDESVSHISVLMQKYEELDRDHSKASPT